MGYKPKAIFVHCQEVYAAMLKESQPYEGFHLYTGYLTKLVTDTLNLPNSYYTFVMNELKRMDCIRKVQRGGGSSPSKWLLIKEPNQTDFDKMPQLARPMTKREAAEHQFRRDTHERLTKIEQALGIVTEPKR